LHIRVKALSAAAAKVYVVDDDDAVRDSLRVLLESHGFDVKAYASARAFLEHVPSTDKSCLLLDLHMPEMDGVELLRILRSQDSTLPVIVTTASLEPLLTKRALEAGAQTLLNKPISEDVLMRSISAAIGGAIPASDWVRAF
jgi:two-component system response regulator FixJ